VEIVAKERRSLNILSAKKEAKLLASEALEVKEVRDNIDNFQTQYHWK